MDNRTQGRWVRDQVRDGENRGPGDNPPSYLGDHDPTNDIVAFDDKTGRFVHVGHLYRGADADFVVKAAGLHNEMVSIIANAVVLFGSRCTNDAQVAWLASARLAVRLAIEKSGDVSS